MTLRTHPATSRDPSRRAHPILLCALAALLGGLSISAGADVRPGGLFTSSAVLQRDQPIPIWGTAATGERVTVKLRDRSAATVAKGGKWMVRLPAMAAGGPYSLTVTGRNRIVLSNIWVGEVYVCSGASNMEWPLALAANGAEAVPEAHDRQLHLYVVPRGLSDTHAADVAGQWQPCTPESARGFSAVAYFFGRSLRRSLAVPVGLIQSVWSGTSAQAWTSRPALTAVPRLAQVVAAYDEDRTAYRKASALYEAVRERILADPEVAPTRPPKPPSGQPLPPAEPGSGPKKTEMPPPSSADPAHPAKTDPVLKAPDPVPPHAAVPGKPEAATQPPERGRPAPKETPDPGKPPVNPTNQNSPSTLFNAMVAPLIPYGIRGVIWYQGEADADEAYLYRVLFPTLIHSWRVAWKQGDFPFLYVQAAPFLRRVEGPRDSAWAELRDAQRETAVSVPNTGMAVTADVGDEYDIHPRDKQTVGDRLALLARALAYKENVESSGPMYASMEALGDKIVLRFSHLGGGLETRGGTTPADFTIAGDDAKFVSASAVIQGDTVVVSSPLVAHPVAVRYGWADYPQGNLWNRAGLPASPFRTDSFPETTQPK